MTEMPPQSSNLPQHRPMRPIIFGEVLFDCFGDQKILGGAPFNVAWNLRGAGLGPHLISAVGADSEGDRVRSLMEQWGMDTAGLQTIADSQTGMVEVTVSQGEPHYEIRENMAYDFVRPLLTDEQIQSAAIFYHGSLAFRSLDNQATIAVLQKTLTCPRFLDINIRQPHFNHQWNDRLLTDLDHLKLNISELRMLCGDSIFEIGSTLLDDCRCGASHLRNRFGIKQFWITLGSSGAVWIGLDDSLCHAPAVTVRNLVDTVGAGDAFAAAIIEGIVTGRSPSESLQRGNLLAAKVCGIRGATTHDSNFYQESEQDDNVRSRAEKITDRTS